MSSGLMFEPRKYTIRQMDGTERVFDQMGTYAGYVKNIGFRFVIVRSPEGVAYLALRSTRTLVFAMGQEQEGGWKERAKRAFAQLVAKAGEDKVLEILRAEESKAEVTAQPSAVKG